LLLDPFGLTGIDMPHANGGGFVDALRSFKHRDESSYARDMGGRKNIMPKRADPRQ
jgi:hypothetical protein